MLQCLHDYFLRTCCLRITHRLHRVDYQSTSLVTYNKLERIFTDTHNRKALLEEFLMRMSQPFSWQVRLRYVIVLFRVCRKLNLYELASETRMPELTASLMYVKCGSVLTARHLENESTVDRKLRQYLVEPLYNYLIRVGEHQSKYLQFARSQPPKQGLTDMFKLCNLLSMLFELRESCKMVLVNYVRVEVVEQLVHLLYQQITMLYGHLKQVLEWSMEHADSLEVLGLVELDVLIRQEKTIYSRVCEFAFLFESFTKPVMMMPPSKLNIKPGHLRRILQSEQLLNLKKETARKVSAVNNNPQWLLSEYMRSSVYDDETSILDEQQSERSTKQVKHQSNMKKKWREDRSDSDGIEGTVENLAGLSIGSLREEEQIDSAIST